jgi:hypothetical protein
VVWLRWPLNVYNHGILEDQWEDNDHSSEINLQWACSKFEGLDIVVAQSGEVVEMDCLVICGMIAITDAMFTTDYYTLPLMGDVFQDNISWMLQKVDRGVGTGDIPSREAILEFSH